MQWCLSGGRVCMLFISHCGGEGLPSSPVHLPSLSPTKLHHPVPPVSPRSECLRSLKGEEGQTLETKLSVHTGSSCCLTNTSCYSRSVIIDATQTPHMLHNVDFHVLICHPHVSFSKESVQIISFFFNWDGCFLYWVLHVFWLHVFHMICKYFLPDCGLSFLSLNCAFWGKELFIFNEVWIKNIFFYRLYICYSN